MPEQLVRLKPGTIVRHFKRELDDQDGTEHLYYIEYFAQHSETKEYLVVYRCLYGDMGVHVRPYDMFMSEVDHNKYPNIKQKYRFEEATTQDYGVLAKIASRNPLVRNTMMQSVITPYPA